MVSVPESLGLTFFLHPEKINVKTNIVIQICFIITYKDKRKSDVKSEQARRRNCLNLKRLHLSTAFKAFLASIAFLLFPAYRSNSRQLLPFHILQHCSSAS
jgi:hypothetical protein